MAMLKAAAARSALGAAVFFVCMSSVSANGKEPFLSMVGVCPIAGQPEGWAVVWHTEIPGPQSVPLKQIERTKSERVFKYLEAPDFDGCLRSLIESDPKAHAAVRALQGATESKPFKVAYKRVNRRWRHFGVDEAIEEVANSGKRGERVERVLKACESLKAQ